MPRVYILLVAAVAAVLSLHAQAQPAAREIGGQVRLGTQTAPPGIPVILRIVAGKYVTPAATASVPETARTITDARGHFIFDRLEDLGRHEGREFFAVSAQVAGYAEAFQVVDLTLVARADVTLDLAKEDLHKQALRRSDSTSSSGASSATAANEPRRSTNAEAQRHLDLAQGILFHGSNAQGSIDELKLAIKSDPWYGPSYILLGLADMQLGRWSDAQLAFSQASKVEPGNAQAYLGMGSALSEQHDFAGAQKALEQALKLNPDSAEAQYELARTLAFREKWQAAEPHARRAIEINPEYSGPHALMANIYLERQDLAGARHEFQEYLKLDPEGSLAAAARQAVTEIDKALADKTH